MRPREVTLRLAFRKTTETSAVATRPAGIVSWDHSMFNLVLALLAGTVTVAAPCTLPMLPILLGASVGQTGKARPALIALGFVISFRSEERRVGKECELKCRSRWSPYH